MKVAGGAVTIQRVENSRRRDDIHQTPAISLFEDTRNFHKAVIHFPAGAFPPDNQVSMENDAVVVYLIPGENQLLVLQVRQLFGAVSGADPAAAGGAGGVSGAWPGSFANWRTSQSLIRMRRSFTRISLNRSHTVLLFPWRLIVRYARLSSGRGGRLAVRCSQADNSTNSRTNSNSSCALMCVLLLLGAGNPGGRICRSREPSPRTVKMLPPYSPCMSS